MTRSKRSKGVVLPPIDASPEEIAQAIFTFDPTHPRLEEGPEQSPSLYTGPPLTIRIQEGSATHRQLEAWETEARRLEEAGSE